MSDVQPTAPQETRGQGFEALAALSSNPQAAAPVYEPKIDSQGRSYATGKRKNAVARVWIKPGSGKITINDRDQEIYFARPVLRMMIAQPLQIADRATQFDVIATVGDGRMAADSQPKRKRAPRSPGAPARSTKR